jgi:PBP1b-binding outer membrane lipoprotein LpoB
MSRNPQPLATLALLAMILAGCAAPAAPTLTLAAKAVSTISAQSVPPASAFKTFNVKVKGILPLDKKGLPHQNFIVIASDGQVYEVNNDTKYGSEVPDLTVGETLVIKGTTYSDTNKQGIHWTHKANQPGDAGWIKTPDGQIYQ